MSPTRPLGRAGMTLVEVLVGTIVALVVLGAAYGTMVGHIREYQVERERIDVQETLRGSSVLLASELQHASASRGDLYAIGADSVSLRSFQSAGAVCGASTDRYALWEPSGSFANTGDDSAVVSTASPGAWKVNRVNTVWTNPGAPVSTCASWTGTPVPPTVIRLTGDTAGVGMGSIVRGFRRTTYRLVQINGRWWLARRVGNGNSWGMLTGPFRAPSDSGLVFRYFTAAGATTTTPSAVTRVEIRMRAESFRSVRLRSLVAEPLRDEMTVQVDLRN